MALVSGNRIVQTTETHSSLVVANYWLNVRQGDRLAMAEGVSERECSETEPSANLCCGSCANYEDKFKCIQSLYGIMKYQLIICQHNSNDYLLPSFL